ncbi:carboxypeptidase-like regulatory domain-containing protein [Pontibacter qinzhouensis]|uniref:Carboxypeptidase-like regulatory domain-containing protein n=1 Tax=Pontibacter qinzhouensis TaxID=2603253 RepID=A0A5C8JIK9_9BACT|nr:carboxypeptidase-like regulatory domain-containing protein [Pontibacter qinzhouensis]TXK36846.1 carboxypeptidase-like regulatory domain-containing protein [Pontibacter qinzhouensis]
MPKRVLLQLFFLLQVLFFSMPLHGQTIIKGTIRSKADNAPIPFVNVGIKQKSVGTVATAEGAFSLKLLPELFDDSLTFSAIGYQEYSVPVKVMLADNAPAIVLNEKVNTLNEVQVTSRKARTRKLGVTSRMPLIMGNVETKGSDDIVELVQLIEVNGRLSDILAAKFYLISNKADSATFRINFYKYHGAGPAQRIVEKSIINRLPLTKGWVAVDLEKYNITLQEDFYLGIEYLPDNPGKEKFLFYYGAVFGGHTYSRNVSLGKWKKTTGGRLSAYVTVRQVRE